MIYIVLRTARAADAADITKEEQEAGTVDRHGADMG
jgi:hypothetical protein